MRVKRTATNAAASIASQVVILVLRLVTRSIFIKTVGVDYLGLDGLFAGVLGFMSIAELGFGTAITTILYKPVAEKDYEKIKTLIKFCKKIYRIIALIMMATALILMPFIHFIIKGNVFPLWELRLYFVLFVLSSCVTYLNYHNITLLITDQKQYIEKTIFTIVNVASGALQLVVLLVLKSYLGFILIRIAGAFIQNAVVSFIATKKYPYLKSKQVEKLSKDDSTKVKKNISALFKYRIGGIAVQSSENIIISAFIGITTVAMYSNYYLIISIAVAFLVQLFGSAYASVGNLWATSETKRVFGMFKNMRLVYFWFFSVLSIGLFVCFQPFITLWIGDEFLLGMPIVMILCINVYLKGMRGVVDIFKDTKGLYYNDRYKPIAEAAVCLTLSLILVNFIGLIGVFIATLTSHVVGIPIESYVLYKKGFQESPKSFFISYILLLLLCACIAVGLYFLCLLYPANIGGFIARVITCVFLPSIAYFLIFHRTEQFKYFTSLFKLMLSKLKRKPKTETTPNEEQIDKE